jgi:hypothetical protein
MDHSFELPDGLSPEEEHATLGALERYLLQENSHVAPWVLAGRLEGTGHGALQARRYVDGGWRIKSQVPFTRLGVPSLSGRGDAR